MKFEILIYRPETLTAEGLKGFFTDVFVSLDANPRELVVRVELPAGADAIIDLADGNPVFNGLAADFRRRWLAEHPVPLAMKAGRSTHFRFLQTDGNRVKVSVLSAWLPARTGAFSRRIRHLSGMTERCG